MDLCGFDKDRTWWYRAWFPTINKPVSTATVLHGFPHWSWSAGDKVDIWAFSNAAAVELFVNGASLGKKTMPQFAHVEWDAVPFVAGSYYTVAYDASGAVLATNVVNTTGAPVAVRATIRDGFGDMLYAGCNDHGLVMAEVVDANGLLVPDASDLLTFTITSGTASSSVVGTCNGDPAGHTNNQVAFHPAFHGLALGVVAAGTDVGTITVTVSAPGLTPATVQMPVAARDPAAPSIDKWCPVRPQW